MKFKRIMPKNATKFEDKECIEYFMNTQRRFSYDSGGIEVN